MDCLCWDRASNLIFLLTGTANEEFLSSVSDSDTCLAWLAQVPWVAAGIQCASGSGGRRSAGVQHGVHIHAAPRQQHILQRLQRRCLPLVRGGLPSPLSVVYAWLHMSAKSLGVPSQACLFTPDAHFCDDLLLSDSPEGPVDHTCSRRLCGKVPVFTGSGTAE